jgi:hypothetical protein
MHRLLNSERKTKEQIRFAEEKDAAVTHMAEIVVGFVWGDGQHRVS